MTPLDWRMGARATFPLE